MKKSQPQAGFTLIESLMAIVVITILLASVGPILSFSVATRVQSRRIEQATQAGKSYVDLVINNSLARTPFSAHNVINASTGTNATFNPSGSLAETADILGRFPGPQNLTLDCPQRPNAAPTKPSEWGYCTSPPGVFCVDGDGDRTCTSTSSADFIIQPIRTTTIAAADIPTTYDPNATLPDNDQTAQTQGYRLAVRVYRAASFNGRGGVSCEGFTGTCLAADKAQSTVTGGAGNGGRPLFRTVAEVNDVQNSRGTPNLGDLCTRVQNTITRPTPSDSVNIPSGQVSNCVP